jgi:hypothetical protein
MDLIKKKENIFNIDSNTLVDDLSIIFQIKMFNNFRIFNILTFFISTKMQLTMVSKSNKKEKLFRVEFSPSVISPPFELSRQCRHLSVQKIPLSFTFKLEPCLDAHLQGEV